MGGEATARPEEVGARRSVQLAVVLLIAITEFGLIARLRMADWGHGEPSRNNIFNYLFVHFERPFLFLLGGFALAVGALAATRRRQLASETFDLNRLPAPTFSATAIIGLVVLVICTAIAYFVLHNHLFSMDEYVTDFQARIFARGQWSAELQWPWRSLGQALAPTFVYWDATTGRWMSGYLPGYSLLRAPFVKVGLGSLLNPLLAATSIVCLAGIARRLWPDEGLRPWIAVALLATSSEFLMTSGTGYSMPAHLALNLLWLWLYLRGDRWSWVAALGVGLVALELHSPFPHALFVAPFLLRMLRDRRWARLLSAAAVYGVGSVAGLAYLRHTHPIQAGGEGLTQLFARPDLYTLHAHLVNLAVLLTWQAPIVGVLSLAALLQPKRLHPVLADMALGVLCTLAFFLWFPINQGHGWGYRYAYQVLGSLVLLAAAGAAPLRSALGDRRAGIVVVGGLAVALLVQLPIRLVETERFVRPFAAADAYVQSQRARVVVVHGESIWYGADLVRNDPFLERHPAVLRASDLTPGIVAQIRRALPNRVVELSDDDFAHLGVLRMVSRGAARR